MFHHFRIGSAGQTAKPIPTGNGGNGGEDDRRERQAERSASPAGERIGDQPAGMGKRKLRCEQRRAIFGLADR
jgi:hypothetical protein